MHETSATVIATSTVYTGRVLSTLRDRVRLPNGQDATMDVVRHSASVILIPLVDPAHIMLVRQYRYVIDQWMWELPAGSVEPDEDVKAAAERECHEEINRIPGTIEQLAAYYPTPGYCDELMVFFRLTRLSVPDIPAPLDADEILEPKVFSLDEAHSLVDRGEIRDMKTALGLTLV